MTSTNVLPSASELYPIIEITQINAEDFRLKKISTGRSQKNIKEHTP